MLTNKETCLQTKRHAYKQRDMLTNKETCLQTKRHAYTHDYLLPNSSSSTLKQALDLFVASNTPGQTSTGSGRLNLFSLIGGLPIGIPRYSCTEIQVHIIIFYI